MNHFDNFYELHHQPRPLLIANSWNVKSAQIIEKVGYHAVATSSGAIADSLGYKDGQQISFEELLYVVKRIKSGINIPLSVDIERGYTQDLETLKAYIQKIIDLGVVGINIEDTEGEEVYLNKLFCIKNYLDKTRQKLFINARTDAFLLNFPSPLETTIKRARMYEDAGADGLFVTGIQSTDVVKEIVTATSLPVNVIGISKFTSISSLTVCGVKRISMAGLLYKATYTEMEEIAKGVFVEEHLL